MLHTKEELKKLVERNALRMRQLAEHMEPLTRQTLTEFLELREIEEQQRCAELSDDTQLRRAQGAATAYRSVRSALSVKTVLPRRAVGRQEV